MRRSMCRTLALAALPLLASVSAQARPPDFPAPDRAKVSVVADNMTVQGRNMSVRAFISKDPVEEIIEFYEEEWAEPPSKEAPPFAHEPDKLAPWHLITRVEDGYVMTVQVQPQGRNGSFGYLALGRLPDPGDGPVKMPEPPAPAGSHVLSNMLTDDPGKSGQTSMIANDLSLDSNVNYYRNLYAGWRKDIDRSLGNKSLHALSFRKGRNEVSITVQSGRGGSMVVVNSVKHDLL